MGNVMKFDSLLLYNAVSQSFQSDQEDGEMITKVRDTLPMRRYLL